MDSRCLSLTLSGARCKRAAGASGFCHTHYKPPIAATVKPDEEEDADTMSFDLPTVNEDGDCLLLSCGHKCHLTLTKCCECMDARPHESGYPRYEDGVGMTLTGLRHDGYCPSCKSRCSASLRNTENSAMLRRVRSIYAGLGVPDIERRAENLVLFIRADRRDQEAMLYAIMANGLAL